MEVDRDGRWSNVHSALAVAPSSGNTGGTLFMCEVECGANGFANFGLIDAKDNPYLPWG